MQLKLKRSQRTGGVISNKLYFCLDARVELTAQECADIDKYKLGKMVIYNSEAAKKHIEAGTRSMMTGSTLGAAKALASFAMASLKLNITIEGLATGTHVECKDMDELLGSENAIMQACENLKAYLDTAATFDGREVLVDFQQGTPQLVA